jgi:putative endonuclease
MSVSADPRRALGALGERLAAEHLTRAGYLVIGRNYRTRFGEIDIIAADSRCLVFCEVKTRVAGRPSDAREPLDSIGTRKRRQIRAMARAWLAATDTQERPRRPEIRFDAIGIVVTSRGILASLEHLEDAF